MYYPAKAIPQLRTDRSGQALSKRIKNFVTDSRPVFDNQPRDPN